MNSFQYAIARAAWEAYRDRLRKPASDFDELQDREQRAWLAAAIAVMDQVAACTAGTAPLF